MSNSSIAVIGAGPIGLEAALYACLLGHPVRVYEQGRIAEHVRRWGHVTFFTPSSMNRSPLVARTLAAAGVAAIDDGTFMRAEAYVRDVLEPLARDLLPGGTVAERTRVVAIGRDGLSKRAPLGEQRRAAPFRLLLDGRDGARLETASIVLDCSGTYGNHGSLGPGGIAAPGECGLGDRVSYVLEPIDGAARERYAEQRVLLVGTGFSAATALAELIELPGVDVTWLARGCARAPYRPIDGDPLPARQRLCELGNRLAAGSNPAIRFVRGASIERFDDDDDDADAIAVTFRCVDGSERIVVDRVLGLVGYRPDRSIARELQLHECYASEGPMALAASLLDAGGDCLAQRSAGPQTLVTPEPGYFVLGAKSYGRNPEFLIRLGLEQIRDVFRLIEGRDDLDLHTAPPDVGASLMGSDR